jgi:hypothetical protein
MRLAPCALLLAGCVTTSQVVPAGKDTYMISAANDASLSAATLRIDEADYLSSRPLNFLQFFGP